MNRRLSVAVATIAATALAGVGTVSAAEPTQDQSSVASLSSGSSVDTAPTTTPGTGTDESAFSSKLLELNQISPETQNTVNQVSLVLTIIAAVFQTAAVAIPIIRYFQPDFLRF
ncbi:hypothetical protein ACXZ66_09335 [Corynebacterium sp. S7]